MFPIHAFSRSELQGVFDTLGQQQTQGIPGVVRLDGPEPGPVLGIMAMTHGNEPAGLAALGALLQADMLKRHLQRGTVYLIVNNLGAGQRYFAEAEDLSFTAHYRFVDQDMNRMPPDLSGDSSELARVRALLPIYEQLTHVLDLHSTSAASDPMLIEVDPAQPLLQVPGVPVVLRGILPLLRGRALVELCAGAQGYVLECGSHEDPAALSIAQAAAWRLLEQLEMLGNPSVSAPVEAELTVYSLYAAVVFPDASSRLERLLSAFEFLAAGTLLAQGDGPPLMIERDSWVIMPPPRLQPVHPGSEFLYLATRA
ncbi:MAG: hypothetical protein ACO1RX_10270 [Candidatus Sericytochromatia bacterium]